MGCSDSTRFRPPLIPANVFPAHDCASLPFPFLTTRIFLFPSHKPGWTAAVPMAAFLHKREDLPT